jgi:hypothetical protein
MMNGKGITRRTFLKGTAALVLAGGLGQGGPVQAAPAARSKVILVRDARVTGAGGEINGPVLQSMLDEAVRLATGEKGALEGWKSLIRANDMVGIKTNSWRLLPTPKEMEEAIRQRVIEAGVPEKNLSVDDRGIRSNPVFINATALINVRPLRTHHWAGVGTCLKNYIMFVPKPSDYHPDGCSELGRIWTFPETKGKTRLNILVALTPQFYGRGANFFDRRYVWPYNGIIVGTDPVAVDAVGAELLRLKRVAHFGEDRALDVTPVHITVADKKYGLGNSELTRIDLTKTGWKEDILL